MARLRTAPATQAHFSPRRSAHRTEHLEPESLYHSRGGRWLHSACLGDMSGSEESTLPRTFPLWAFVALLGNVLLSLLKLILHGLWLAPQCIAAAVRRRRGDPAPAPEPGLEFYEGKVNHTRLWPVFHTFTYPVRASKQRDCCSGRTCREAPSST